MTDTRGRDRTAGTGARRLRDANDGCGGGADGVASRGAESGSGGERP